MLRWKPVRMSLELSLRKFPCPCGSYIGRQTIFTLTPTVFNTNLHRHLHLSLYKYLQISRSLSTFSHPKPNKYKMPEKDISFAVKEPRLVVRKFLARPQHEGLGAIVRRSIGRYVIIRSRSLENDYLESLRCFSNWVSFFFFPGLSWDTLILFLFWMNSQVGFVFLSFFDLGSSWNVMGWFLFSFLGILQSLLLLDFLIIHIEVFVLF